MVYCILFIVGLSISGICVEIDKEYKREAKLLKIIKKGEIK